MSPELKKQISDHLIVALGHEDLPRREGAKFLNLNPCYISMAINPGYLDSLSQAAWGRLEARHNTREKISEYKIPEGEEVWQPKEKPAEVPKKDKDIFKSSAKVSGPEDLSPEKKEAAGVMDEGKKPATTTRQRSKLTAPFAVEEKEPGPDIQFTDTARLKVALDIEINLVINGQKIHIS